MLFNSTIKSESSPDDISKKTLLKGFSVTKISVSLFPSLFD